MKFITTSILKLVISSFIFIQTSGICAESTKYLRVNLPSAPGGMFSAFCYVAGVLFHYDQGGFAGIEVDFEKSGFYYDPFYGSNWWKYYCKPIRIGNKRNAELVQMGTMNWYCYYAFFTEKRLSRKKVFNIIQKYIKIKRHVQTKIDDFAQKNFTGFYVISVHYRGSDKYLEAEPVPYHKVAKEVKKHIEKNKLKNYKIFVASDEQTFIDFMQNSFSGSTITYDAHRSFEGIPPHQLQSEHKFEIGEEALIDCILLSMGNVLIRTSSNLSLWSTYFNPFIPVIELSQRSKEFDIHIRQLLSQFDSSNPTQLN